MMKREKTLKGKREKVLWKKNIMNIGDIIVLIVEQYYVLIFYLHLKIGGKIKTK